LAELTPEQAAALEGGLALAQADKMVENAIGIYALPMASPPTFW